MARNQYYVDPAIDANSGTGTIGDPFGDLQYALDNITRDDANGDQINIKSGADEVLAATLSFATFGQPGATWGLIVAGYDATANDGGIGVIDCNGNLGISGNIRTRFHNLEIKNSGANSLVNTAFVTYESCFFHGSTTGPAVAVFNGVVCRCRIELGESFSGNIVEGNIETLVLGNYLKSNGTGNARGVNSARSVSGNIISMANNATAFGVVNSRIVENNTIVGNIGTGVWNLATFNPSDITDNLFVGPSKIVFSSTSVKGLVISGNASFGETTMLDVPEVLPWWEPVESLPSDPLARTGDDTFANRLNYYRPLNIGSVLNGGVNGGTKGAVAGAIGTGTAGFTGIGRHRRLGT